jgi:hypothetical protein
MPVFEWQTVGQKEGKYRAETKTLLGGKTVEENSFKFNVGDVAATSNEIALSNNKILAGVAMLGRGNLMYGWFVIAGFLLLIALILSLITKKISKRREI